MTSRSALDGVPGERLYHWTFWSVDWAATAWDIPLKTNKQVHLKE